MTDRSLQSSSYLQTARNQEAVNEVLRHIVKTEKVQQKKQTGILLELHKKLKAIQIIVFIVYLGLAFFEKPVWCQDTAWDFSWKKKYHGQDVEPPTSNLPLMPQRPLHAVEILCIWLLAALVVLRFNYTRATTTSKMRSFTILVLWLISFIENIIVIVTQDVTYWCQLIRPLIFVLFIRSIREGFLRLIKMMIYAKAVIFLLVLLIMFYSFIGWFLFTNQVEGEEYFETFHDALWNMLVLLTTANYPDVMMPSYRYSRIYWLFFISFLVISLFFLLNLMLAVFYNNYRKQVEKRAAKFADRFPVRPTDSFETYDMESYMSGRKMTVEGTLALFRKHLKRLDLTLTDCHELLKFLKLHGVISNLDSASVLHALYNQKRNERINEKPFLVVWGWAKLSTLTKIEVFLNGIYFEAFINIINASNLAALYLEDYFPLWPYLSTAYMIIYWIEGIGKVCSMGFKSYFKRFGNKFDTGLNILSLLFLVIYAAGASTAPQVLRFVLVLRTFRILKLLGEIREYRIIFKTFISLLPMYGRIFGLLVFTFYMYSIVGQYLYGGLIFKENLTIIEDTLVPNTYVYNNFNDFATGLVTLFELLVVNNWWVIANMYSDVTNKWARLFFASFYFWAVLIVVNLVVAFVIDMFTAQYEIQESRESGAGQPGRHGSMIDEIHWAEERQKALQDSELEEMVVNRTLLTSSSNSSRIAQTP